MQLGRNDSIRLVGINYKDKPENARRFLGSLGNPFSRIGADTKGSAAIDWGVYGVPETFIIDREGIIRFRWTGPITEQLLKDVIVPRIRSSQNKARN